MNPTQYMKWFRNFACPLAALTLTISFMTACSSGDKRDAVGCIEGDCDDSEGVYVWPGGGRYVGTFQKAIPHGRGAMIYLSGATCEGQWSAGKLDGVAACTLPNRDVYDGVWQAGVIHGKGTYHYQDGGKYVGQFENHLRSGTGRMEYPDGFIYTGEWNDNRCHGQGTLTGPDGREWTGRFHRGYFITPDNWIGPTLPETHSPDDANVPSE